MRSWTRLASSGTRLASSLPFLANASRRSSMSLTRALDLATALAQFTLDAHAGFAHLALEAFAGGDAAALEAAQLSLGLGGRGVGRERVGDASRRRGRGRSGRRRPGSAPRARRSRRTRRRCRGWRSALAERRLGLVHGAGARALGVDRFGARWRCVRPRRCGVARGFARWFCARRFARGFGARSLRRFAGRKLCLRWAS